MIEDILYTDQFLVFEVPEDTAAGYVNSSGQIQGFSYDGNNFIFAELAEVTSVFVS